MLDNDCQLVYQNVMFFMQNQCPIIGKTCEVEELVFRRLQRYKRDRNLITYEGTAEDKLCLNFVKSAWDKNEYEVLCSIRPCMDIQLQEEVHSYAQLNGYQFVDYVGDCVVDEQQKQFISTCCQGSIMDNWSRDNFESVNEKLQSFSTNNSSLLAKPGPKSMADWDTLFLFDGLSHLDFLATYLKRISTTIEDYEIPVCYLLCYNEQQQLAIREMIRGSFEQTTQNCKINSER